MPLRQLLLRVLLWSLGLAAFFGAAGILLAEFGAIWRIAGTALWTGFCAALLLLCSVLVDRPKARPAGLLGMTTTVIEYLLVLPLLWFEGGRTTGFDWQEFLFFQIWFLPLCAVPAMVMLWMTRSPQTKIAGWTGTAWCAAGFVLLLIGSIAEASVGRLWWGRNQAFELTLALGALGPLAILALVGAGTDRRYWRWIGVAAAAGAFAAVANEILARGYGEGELFAILVSVAAVVAHTNVMLQIPLPGRQRWLAVASAAAGAVTGAAVAGSALIHWTGGNQDWPPLALTRVGSAAAVLAGCGTLAVLVLARINRRDERPSPSRLDLSQVTVICPVCRRKQALPPGEARCGGCGLIIRIGLEEPRCAVCDYSLLMFAGDRCPECGAPVPRGAGGAASPAAVAEAEPLADAPTASGT